MTMWEATGSRVNGASLAVALVVAVAMSVTSCGKPVPTAAEAVWALQGHWVGKTSEFVVNGREVSAVSGGIFEDRKALFKLWVNGKVKTSAKPGFTIVMDHGKTFRGKWVTDTELTLAGPGSGASDTFRLADSKVRDTKAWEADARGRLAGRWKARSPKDSEKGEIALSSLGLAFKLDKKGDMVVERRGSPNARGTYLLLGPHVRGPRSAPVRYVLIFNAPDALDGLLVVLWDGRMLLSGISNEPDYLMVFERD